MVLIILVLNAGNAGATVRVVFNVLDDSFSASRQIEVHQSIELARTATTMAGRNTALVVAARVLLFDNGQALERFFGSYGAHVLRRHTTSARSRRLVLLNSHYFFSFFAGFSAFLSSSSLAKSAMESPSLSVT